MVDADGDAGRDEGWLVAGSTSPDDVRRYYDELADDYDATLATWGYDAPAVAARLLIDAIGADAGSNVLDAGCGTGLVGVALRQAGFGGTLQGLDLSPASVELATRRHIYTSVEVADLQRPLPLADGSVDAVICVGVLTYVPDIEAIWREFCRVTRSGGAIVLTQRDDVWDERRCGDVLDRLERERCWTVTHLSPPSSYLPGNDDFADQILVRFLRARSC